MPNIFDTIKNQYPAPEADKQRLAAMETPVTKPTDDTAWAKQLKTDQLVMLWQKDPNEAYTSELLTRMKPTIASAMSTYAPGQDEVLSVKAAKLTLDALKTYKPGFGTQPSTYVFHNLKRLNRYANERAHILPESEAMQVERKQVTEASARFEDEHNREPSITELADITGFSKKKLEKLMSQNAVVNESSTYAEGTTRSTLASSDLTDNDYFDYVYASVSPIDQQIMDWTAGRHGKPVLSGNEIARRLKITPAAISQHKQNIANMLADVRSYL